jgi:hypothetical protein
MPFPSLRWVWGCPARGRCGRWRAHRVCLASAWAVYRVTPSRRVKMPSGLRRCSARHQGPAPQRHPEWDSTDNDDPVLTVRAAPTPASTTQTDALDQSRSHAPANRRVPRSR